MLFVLLASLNTNLREMLKFEPSKYCILHQIKIERLMPTLPDVYSVDLGVKLSSNA